MDTILKNKEKPVLKNLDWSEQSDSLYTKTLAYEYWIREHGKRFNKPLYEVEYLPLSSVNSQELTEKRHASSRSRIEFGFLSILDAKDWVLNIHHKTVMQQWQVPCRQVFCLLASSKKSHANARPVIKVSSDMDSLKEFISKVNNYNTMQLVAKLERDLDFDEKKWDEGHPLNSWRNILVDSGEYLNGIRFSIESFEVD